MGVLDFLSNEAGQKRRQWLDEKSRRVGGLLQYYAGPYVDVDRAAGLLDMFNPVADTGRAMQAGREGRYGDMAVDVASVVAPVAAGKAAKAINPRMADDAAQWLQDALTGLSVNPTRAGLGDAGQRFAADEYGGVDALRKQPTPAQEVAALLREGRADEVTDDLLAQADDYELFRLYESGATGVDMPMDEASRMARAREMGFDADAPVYHGGLNDITGFRTDQKKTDHGWYGDGVYFGDEDTASIYAMNSPTTHRPEGGNVIPAVTRGNIYEWPEGRPAALDADDAARISDALQRDGYAGANIYAPNDYDTWGDQAGSFRERVIFNPANIRSRFARFDPRLSHLRNLSAGVGGLGAMGLLSMQPDRATTEQETRQYLGGLL